MKYTPPIEMPSYEARNAFERGYDHAKIELIPFKMYSVPTLQAAYESGWVNSTPICTTQPF